MKTYETNLIVRVRRFNADPLRPYFSFYNKPAIAKFEEAKKIAKKLNELAQLEKKEYPLQNDHTETYYAVPMTL